ncbi:elongin-C [Nephila pilipes]|uniref:Elongin-C n=1 Tax=Nephila pilipes TaxID=299642 RepID=A0A8X6TGK6_NEPPI|nr:elongin-C [Nephila pilipes]
MADVKDSQYGGSRGEDSMYVKIISYDSHNFYMKRQYIVTSKAIQKMLDIPPLASDQDKPVEENEVKIGDYSSLIIQKICQYFAYKARYFEGPIEIPNFDIDLDIALQLLLAANFLDC